MFWIIVGLTVGVLALETVVVACIVRKKHLDRWLPSYLFSMGSCPAAESAGHPYGISEKFQRPRRNRYKCHWTSHTVGTIR